MRSLAWLSVLALVGGGCQLYELPDTPPGRDQVFGAARAVIQEHYPLSAPVEKSDLILARSQVELMGSAKSQRQITVWVKRNYIGAWEPKVRVVLYQEVAEPVMRADPTSESPGGAVPIATEKWQPIQHLPVEEQKLTEAILARIQI